MSIFNIENTEWKDGNYSLILGQEPALHDSVNTRYPKLFELYKLQKSIDWSEDELSLENSRMDMLNCPDNVRDIMLKNLAFQWEADSIASRSIAPLFAPFITNSEYWAAILKTSETEVLHALTYSEIVRQCIPDPHEVFKEVMENNNITTRLTHVARAFQELKVAGAKYTLGLMSKEEAFPIVMNGTLCLYCLERLEFMASFADTFGTIESTQMFQEIGTLVAKIMCDERWVHAEVGAEALRIMLATKEGAEWRVRYAEDIKKTIDEVVQAEYDWNSYLFSEGRKLTSSLNESSANEWVDWNAQDVYKTLQFTPPKVVTVNPLKYMDHWLNLDKFQNANQEKNSANYVLNSVVDDVEENYIFE